MILQGTTLKNKNKHTSGGAADEQVCWQSLEWKNSWRWNTAGGRHGKKEMEWHDNRRHSLAFLPLIGVPPGEVIWMQIRLEKSVSIKRKGRKLKLKSRKFFKARICISTTGINKQEKKRMRSNKSEWCPQEVSKALCYQEHKVCPHFSSKDLTSPAQKGADY